MGRRLVVHIGLPKTATTYIQSGLFTNRAALRQLGVFLPQSGRLNLEPNLVAHHHLAWEMFSPRRFEPSSGGWEELRRELRTAAADVVLLSSEEFSRVTTKGVADAFEQNLRSLCDDVTVVMVIRDQLSWLNSTYLQRVKVLAPTSDFDTFVDRSLEGGWFDLDRAFRRWYSSEWLHLSVVSFSSLVSGDPLRSVLAAGGIDLAEHDTTVPPAETNPSLGPVGAEAHRLLERYLTGRYPEFSWRDRIGRRLHRLAGGRSRREGWCADDFWGWAPGPAAAAAAHFRDSNERFAHGAHLGPWTERMPVNRPQNRVILEDLDPATTERVHQFVFAMTQKYTQLREAGLEP